MARKAISKKTRFDVFKRDRFTCQYCGATPPGVLLHLDHIHPVAEGGGNTLDNLLTACEPCNLGKGARLLSEVPAALKDKAAELMEREAQIRGYNEVLQYQADRIADEMWFVAGALQGSEDQAKNFDRKNLQSIKMFLGKLAFQQVLDSAESAYAKFSTSPVRMFSYFCGICWAKIKEAKHGD
jgi:DNA-directed RNA polymerase subunit RPC12/RpoP